MSTVIKVENLSKSYRLGSISTGSLHKDLQSFWARMRGKEDPNRRIGEMPRHQTKDELFWALKDISFEVQQGQVLGILGRNGAGKSTLLKILSRITAPTQGSIKIRGRIASLLEVGTGFHPELTGRENVYLNGAILGMTRREIDRKFAEIVDFAEIEQFIDSPVKRYSSGMYVRLAFAVAAHLEPEILIVDEVLAVGDAQFQKKCLGKMEDVGRQGRTILFVSHNTAAMRQLCSFGLFLESGMITNVEKIEESITKYLKADTVTPAHNGAVFRWGNESGPGNDCLRITEISLSSKTQVGERFSIGEDLHLNIDFQILKNKVRPLFNLMLFSPGGDEIFASISNNYGDYAAAFLDVGHFRCSATIEKNFLNNIEYSIQIHVFESYWQNYAFSIKERIRFEILDDVKRTDDFTGKYGGLIRPILQWNLSRI